jgi:hypothetical protein
MTVEFLREFCMHSIMASTRDHCYTSSHFDIFHFCGKAAGRAAGRALENAPRMNLWNDDDLMTHVVLMHCLLPLAHNNTTTLHSSLQHHA